MTDKPLKWGDIALHSAPAALFGGFCGFGGWWGIAYLVKAPTAGHWWLGVLGFLGSIVALAWLVLTWLNRESLQHDFRTGGRQSQWEWKAPAVVSVVAYVATVIVMNSI